MYFNLIGEKRSPEEMPSKHTFLRTYSSSYCQFNLCQEKKNLRQLAISLLRLVPNRDNAAAPSIYECFHTFAMRQFSLQREHQVSRSARLRVLLPLKPLKSPHSLSMQLSQLLWHGTSSVVDMLLGLVSAIVVCMLTVSFNVRRVYI